MATAAPNTNEQGFAGAVVMGGRFDDDYLADVRGDKWFGVVDRMRRGDGTISAMEQCLTLPIRSAKWRIQPAGGNSPGAADTEAAEWVERNLFGGMTSSWSDTLRHICLAPFYGFTMMEKVFEERDGKIAWRKWASRRPATRSRWLLDPNGGLMGVEQRGQAVNGYKTVTIPVEYLLVFTFRQEYGNYDGFSILRPAYKHWSMRDACYKTFNLGLEKNLIGMIVGTMPANVTREQEQAFLSLLQQYRASGTSYMALPNGYTVDRLKSDGTFLDVLPYIAHHGQQMTMAALAQFLMLGTGDVGSYALSSDQSDLFLLSENAWATDICDVVNNYAIPQLCRYNWEGMTEFPKLACDRISGVDITGTMAAILDATSAGLLAANVETEEWVRGLLGAPELSEEVVKARQEQDKQAALNPPPPVDPNAPPAAEDPAVSRADRRKAAADRARQRKQEKAGNG